ncbi:MAG: hypothetical protein VX460_02240 [Planctomycetota bacterium]|nr:hypothetical protein [Planctomycetota bacterium]
MAVGPRRTRPRPIGPVLFLGLLILSLGWVLYLRVTDQPLRDPFGFYQPGEALPAAQPDDRKAPVMLPAEGMARVYLAARPIQAYSRVSRDDLFDPVRGVFAYVDLEEEYVEEKGLIGSVTSIAERVLKRDKRQGFAFTEDDFLPAGTRPGLVGGIPKGMRALRLDGDVVEGIIGLRTGDRFDIVAASGPQPKPTRPDTAPVGLELTGPYAEQARRPTRAGAPAPSASQPGSRVEVVVSNGVVIYPLDTRLIPTSSTGLMTGQVTGTRPVQEMVIAVPTESVARLMAAISDESQLTCVARSGLKGGDSDDVMPGFDRAAPADSIPSGYDEGGFAIVETIVGGQRTLTAVPKAGSRTEDGQASAADDEGGSDR